MAREIKPTPVLDGQDVIEFYKKLAGFKDNFKRLGIAKLSVKTLKCLELCLRGEYSLNVS